MAEQLTFELPRKTALGVEDYFVSDANVLASNLIENWHNWPEKRLLLLGPKGAGKTHLARIWADQSDAKFVDLQDFNATDEAVIEYPIVVENLESLPRDAEENLFHLLNLCAQSQQYILLTARGGIGSWSIQLPDLESRLRQATQAEISEPDDELLLAVLLKQFQDRGLSPAPNVVTYLKTHMPRSFEAVSELVSRLDRKNLLERKKVSLGLARDVLAELS